MSTKRVDSPEGFRQRGTSRAGAAEAALLALGDIPRLVWLLRSGWDNPRERGASVIYVGSGRKRKPAVPLLRRLAILSALLMQSRTASAQTAPIVTPVEMFDPERGDGVRLSGKMDLYASIVADLVYDDNVYNTPVGERSDTIGVLRPKLALVSNFARHRLRLRTEAEVRRYARIEAENSEQYAVTGDGLLELGERIEIAPQAGYARRIERRGTLGDQFFTDRPIAFDERFVGVEVSRTGGRLEARATGRIYKADYDRARRQGVTVDLNNRDVVVRRASFRASYSVSEATRLFAEVNGNQVCYSRNPVVSRNSSGYAALAGMQFEVAALVQAEAGAGYIRQTFANPAYKPVKGANYWLAAKWTPTPHWQLTARGEKQIDRSPRDDTPAIVRSLFEVEVKRALGDRLLLSAIGGFVTEDYAQSFRKDRRHFVEASAHYRLTEGIGVIASAGYRKRNGNRGIERDYEGFSGSIGVSAKW